MQAVLLLYNCPIFHKSNSVLWTDTLAYVIGISTSALPTHEVDENRTINSYNLRILAKSYNVTSDYLLGLIETRRLSPLSTGSLRISDDAVKVLQDGKYNPLSFEVHIL